ncbi:MAG: SGNH/GDSL hydrolase family protein [Acidimicrobiales bacterium]
MAASNVVGMGEHDQLADGTRRRARHRHLVMGGEAFLAIAALLLAIGLFELRPSTPIRSETPTSTSSPPPPSSVPTGPVEVKVIGDSLVSQSFQEQHDVLRARGYDVTVAASPGKPMSDPWIQEEVAEAAADPQLDIVVLATAANDNLANAGLAMEVGDRQALARYRALLRSTLARLGDRCVVLVDARDIEADYFAASYATRSNATLDQVAAARPGTEVVAWSDISRPHTTDWFVADGEHFHDRNLEPHPAGAAAYARAIADGVDRCARRG